MMSKLPTLTDDKILENDNLIINKLYEYFLASEYSQTFFYKKHIASLKYLIGEYSVDDDELLTAITSTLEILYLRYFDEVEVLCEIVPDNAVPDVYIINININVTNNGNSTTLYKSVTIANNKIDFFKTNNILLYKKEL